MVLPPLHVSSAAKAADDTQLGKGPEAPLHPHFASTHAPQSEIDGTRQDGDAKAAAKRISRGAKGGRTRTLTLRLSVEELAVLDAKAREAGLSIGSFLRACSLGSAGPRARRQPPLNAELLAYATAQLNKVGGNLNQLMRRLNAAEAVGAFECSIALTEVRSAVRGIVQTLTPSIR